MARRGLCSGRKTSCFWCGGRDAVNGRGCESCRGRGSMIVLTLMPARSKRRVGGRRKEVG
jgi:hypothetical protein